VLAVATRLGLTSFGGPVAHLGYFRDEYVVRRRWLDDESYADLVALCQLLPGPASSQLGIAIGALRAGKLGAAAAWLGFTLPSAVAMVVFAYAVEDSVGPDAGWLHGLAVVAVAVVAYAVLGMARRLAPDLARLAIVAAAATVALAVSGAPGQLLPIVGAAALGALVFRDAGLRAVPSATRWRSTSTSTSLRFAVAALVVFVVLLAGLPLLRSVVAGQALALFDSFYRAGALVFGGGHVILPLLHAEVVDPGWVSDERFVAGYGAAQAVPGPLTTFAAYLGTVAGPEPNGVPGAALALVAIFLPSFLLVAGTLPVWSLVRSHPRLAGSLRAVNAAVVGLVLAALYDPVWTTAIDRPRDVLLAAALFVLLVFRLPAWAVVGVSAASGAAFL
jgi:chromate transporter